MKESTEMEDYDGYLDRFIKEHRTNNLLLRWFANLCEIPAHYHLNKFLYYSDHKDYGLVSRSHAKISHWFYKPYLKWGTVYKLDVKAINEAWALDPDHVELMGRLGSDYDENGIPYWDKD